MRKRAGTFRCTGGYTLNRSPEGATTTGIADAMIGARIQFAGADRIRPLLALDLSTTVLDETDISYGISLSRRWPARPAGR